MKRFLIVLPIILCSLLMAVHFGRANMFILQLLCTLIPFLLFWRSKFSARILQLLLILFGLEWIRALIYYIRIRISHGEDWYLLAIILGTVIAINFATLLVFRTKFMKKRYKLN